MHTCVLMTVAVAAWLWPDDGSVQLYLPLTVCVSVGVCEKER